MRALDLFCCAGGAAMGLHRAGFEVVGVDSDYINAMAAARAALGDGPTPPVGEGES